MNLIIEIGGTTFTYGLVKLGKILFRSNIFLIRSFETIDDIFLFIKSKITENIIGICIACPGPLDYKTGLIGDSVNIPMIAHKNLKVIVNKYFDIKNNKIVVENDANVFALGEFYNLNKNPTIKVSVSLTLGTGLGMGIIIDSKIFKGGNLRGPEYSLSKINGDHNWEYYLGTQYFTRLSKENYNQIYTPKELAFKASHGDIISLKIWKYFGLYLGKYLSHIINLFDPNIITIGGGISKSNNFYMKYIFEYLKENCILYDKEKCPIQISDSLLDSSYIGGYKCIVSSQ